MRPEIASHAEWNQGFAKLTAPVYLNKIQQVLHQWKAEKILYKTVYVI